MLAYLVAKGEPVKLGTCKTKLEDQADHISTTWLTPERFDIVSYLFMHTLTLEQGPA